MNKVYVVDPDSKTTAAYGPTGLSAAGIQERSDLQEWVLSNPEILGEPLCIISSEFAAFDRANRRIDILALDADVNLVVIELKLELDRSFADLQALRYAAFCSTMTSEQVIREYARFHRVSKEEAEQAITEFLGIDDTLPEPEDRPRIILVAGTMDDPEILSTVLWLRRFELDIRCIEVTPYRLPDAMVLVPQTIVPLPEVEQYLVRVERKESAKARGEAEVGPYHPLWRLIQQKYDALETRFKLKGKPRKQYYKVRTGSGECHYEWQVRKGDDEFHVAVHFESKDRERNYQLLEVIRSRVVTIQADVDAPFEAREWGKKWAYGAFVLNLPEDPEDEQFAERSASLMQLLIERTWPALREELQ